MAPKWWQSVNGKRSSSAWDVMLAAGPVADADDDAAKQDFSPTEVSRVEAEIQTLKDLRDRLNTEG